MSEKLRELEEYILCDDENNDELWAIYWGIKKSIKSQPKNETVEKWEERTGETYPDDSMTWAWIQGDCYSGDEWLLMEYCHAKENVDFPSFQIVVCEKPIYVPEEAS